MITKPFRRKSFIAPSKHGEANVFEGVDAYVRGRLRSILRKRSKKKGRFVHFAFFYSSVAL
jgi:hypothetical protein